jgi:hypothetical protein
VVASGTYYVRISRKSGEGLLGQYLLDLEMVDAVAPFITSVNLPADGTASTAVIDRFTIGFSKDLDPESVTSSANFRAASSRAGRRF